MNNESLGPHPGVKSILILGHPGHELRVYGWVERMHPMVCILTDGSGGSELPRIERSRSILCRLGAKTGPIFGGWSDRKIYQHILEIDHSLFQSLCVRLADVIVEHGIEQVVSDAIEGYNPTHDLCEVLARNAVTIASRRSGGPIRHYTIPLVGDPRPIPDQKEYERIELSTAGFREKLRVARGYCGASGSRLQGEIEEAIEIYGEDAFAQEYLFPAALPGSEPERRFEETSPFYEEFGERQVAARRFAYVIRFREHVGPLMTRLNAVGSVEDLSQVVA